MNFTKRIRLGKMIRYGLFFIALLPAVSSGEIRLLTGDSNNATHQTAGVINDLSADGNLVLFTSGPPVSGTTPGIPSGGLYLRNISANTLEFVSDTTVTNIGVAGAAMSDDGRYLTWASTNSRQIYWRDRTAGITRLVTAGATGTHGDPRMSGDGRYVAFVSSSRNLVPDPTKLPDANRGAVFLYDSVMNSVSIASLAPNGGRLTGAGPSSAAAFSAFDISRDGRFVVYTSEDPNAHPDKSQMTAGFFGVFRRNISTGEVVLLNRNSAGNVSDGSFGLPRINADGSRVAFSAAYVGYVNSQKTMVGSYANVGFDIYAKDVTSGDVWLLTKTPDGTPHSGAIGVEHAISDSGAMVSFASSSDQFFPGGDLGKSSNGFFDVFRADLGATGAVTLSQMTVSPSNSGNIDYTDGPYVPGNGDYVAFGTHQLSEMGYEDRFGSHGVAVGSFAAGGSGALAFSTWAVELPSGQQGFLDNPSGDGVKNLVKYFIGSDPKIPDLRHLPADGKAKGTDLGLAGDLESYLTLSVRIRRDRPAGFTWAVQASGNLVDLVSNPVAGVQVGGAIVDGDFDVFTFRFPTSISGSATGFMRLKVSAP